ncbi:hypothetical protein B7P43_G01510 [Cryptotermes secundus]|uniref:Inosine/uridine-preferring nucleoside hydrolase domain-containing protein n=1 Tax=Cryptotermes secundus TaxID=105785 RepID=A0A2J7RET5_9NEOP|nr:hypothetical protein B7P43_G01510 [Cryptotermes secundus]
MNSRSPEEKEEQQKVLNEEAALDDQYQNGRLAVVCLRQAKKFTQGDGGCLQKFVSARGRMICHIVPTPRKGHGRQGPGKDDPPSKKNKDDDGTHEPAGTLSGNHPGRMLLRREQLESNYCENRPTGKAVEANHRRYKHSLRKRNGDTPVGYSGRIAVKGEQRTAAGSDYDMAAVQSRRVLNLVIDTDVGSDDAMAIILCSAAQRKGDANIWGITCVHGNTSLQNVCANTLKTLHTLGRLDIPVFRGAADSIVETFQRAENIHGSDGFGNFDYRDAPDVAQVMQKENAVNYLTRIASQNPGAVTLLCLGPLTNVALAIRMDPSFCTNVKEIFIMGGNIEGIGNVTAAAEFNFWCDPEAAYVTIHNMKCQITIFPWEAAYKYGRISYLHGREIRWRRKNTPPGLVSHQTIHVVAYQQITVWHSSFTEQRYNLKENMGMEELKEAVQKQTENYKEFKYGFKYMESHKIQGPAGSQDGTEAAAGSGDIFHPRQGNCDRYHAYQRGSGLSQQSRDGHHINMSILARRSKHGTVPSGSTGMIGKPGAPHHEHYHPRTIAECRFIWRSALALKGLKMKIWRERIGTPHKAVHSEPHARGKKKISLRARLLKEFPDLKAYSSFYRH